MSKRNLLDEPGSIRMIDKQIYNPSLEAANEHHHLPQLPSKAITVSMNSDRLGVKQSKKNMINVSR